MVVVLLLLLLLLLLQLLHLLLRRPSEGSLPYLAVERKIQHLSPQHHSNQTNSTCSP